MLRKITPAAVQANTPAYRELCSVVLLLLLPLTIVSASQAQTAHFAGTQSVVGTGLNDPRGVAVDASGNVYIADTGNSRVLRVPVTDLACATAANCTPVGSGFYNPTGVATDAAGNVYVANTGYSTVVKVPLTDLSCATPSDCSSIGPGLLNPVTALVAGSGNVYVAQYTNGVAECAAGTCGSVAGRYITGATYGLALDATGKLYITLPTQNNIFYVGASGCPISTNGDCGFLQVPGLNNPAGIALDSTNHLYIADTGHNRILKVPLADPTCSTPGDCASIGTGLSSPFGVALDASGSLYVADAANNRVLKLNLGGYGDLGSVALGTSSALPLTLVFTFDSSTTLGSSPVAVLTNGVPNADFTDAGSGTCATNGAGHTYAAGESCTVDVTFTPTLPGSRLGAVVLSGSNGTVLATGAVRATGVARRSTSFREP